MKVLVIEDDPDIQIILRAVLTRLADCEVDVASEGIDGLKRAKTSRPDFILLDLMLPSFSGYEVCKSLKEDAATQMVPVIFLTATARPAETTRKAQALGALGILAKPFDPMTLIAQINALLKPVKLSIQENGKGEA